MEEKCPCTRRTKQRPEEELRALKNRLSRIEGQIRGLSRMVDENAYCTDIITQTSAVTAALNAFTRELLSAHIRTCVTEDLRQGKAETAEELVETLNKLMK